ncbi:MAG: phage holin family protein [Verrucomicrobiae bacterium]|nr:phage holin family protein [Verrucomicrobiae bacterium]
MKKFFLTWLANTVAVLAASHIVPGINYHSWSALLIAALLLGLLNSFLRPLLMLVSLPLLILTLGLFTVFINGLCLWIVGHLVHGFVVRSFWSAVLGSLVISLVNLMFRMFQKREQKERVSFQTKTWTETVPNPSNDRGNPNQSSSGGGRVIDV